MSSKKKDTRKKKKIEDLIGDVYTLNFSDEYNKSSESDSDEEDNSIVLDFFDRSKREE